MEKITIKEFYKQLTKGKANMIGYFRIKKGKEENFLNNLQKQLNDDDKMKEIIDNMEELTYTKKSYGAVSSLGSDLRHSKENTYFKNKENALIVKVNWDHVTIFIVYGIK